MMTLLIKAIEYFKTQMKNMNRRSYQTKEIPSTDEESMLFEGTLLHLILSLRVCWLRCRIPAGTGTLYPACVPREASRVVWTYSRREQAQLCLSGPRPQASQSQCEKQWRARHRSLEYCLGPGETTKIQLVLQEKWTSMFYSCLQKRQ